VADFVALVRNPECKARNAAALAALGRQAQVQAGSQQQGQQQAVEQGQQLGEERQGGVGLRAVWGQRGAAGLWSGVLAAARRFAGLAS
jgi:hypothetical protein